MIRGLLRELGIFIPVGARKVVPRVLELLEVADSQLPDTVRNTLHEVCLEVRDYEQRMRDVEKQLEALSKQIPTITLLRTVPGIGLLTSTALFAFVGDIRRFRFIPTLRSLSRAHSTAAGKRIRHTSRPHQQTRRPLPTNACLSWRT